MRLAVLTATLFFNVSALAQGRLADLFEQARRSLASAMLELDYSSFPGGGSSVEARWLVSRREQLANDVWTSPHEWFSGATTGCAYTKPAPGEKIYLSLEECDSVAYGCRSRHLALLVPTLNHLGLIESYRAQAMARTALEASRICPRD